MVAASVLVGIVIGVAFSAYYLYLNRDKLSILREPVKVNSDLPREVIDSATALTPGRMLFGKVSSKAADSFAIEVTVANILDPKNPTSTQVTIPFNSQKDEVSILKSASNKPTEISPTPATFSDIKIGSQLFVRVQQDNKVIYLLPTQ